MANEKECWLSLPARERGKYSYFQVVIVVVSANSHDNCSDAQLVTLCLLLLGLFHSPKTVGSFAHSFAYSQQQAEWPTATFCVFFFLILSAVTFSNNLELPIDFPLTSVHFGSDVKMNIWLQIH